MQTTIDTIEERTGALESWERTDLIRDTAGYLAEYLNGRLERSNTNDAFYAQETVASLLDLFASAGIIDLS